jgi:threonyl-tRNA synthetase
MKITLPDNSFRDLPDGSSGYDLAKDIGPGLAKSAVAITVNGEQKDLT